MALNRVVSDAVQATYLALLCVCLVVQIIKMRHIPESNKSLTLCRVLTLKRLSLLIVSASVFKVVCYYALVYDPWVSQLPCNPNLVCL